MNALVTYESSSDDETSELIQQEPQVGVEGSSSLHKNGLTSTNIQNNHRGNNSEEEGPVLGPAIGDNAIEKYPEYNDQIQSEDENQLPTSERDILRHLTQATHPMKVVPPSPPGSPAATTSTKFQRFLDLKAKGIHFNEDLAKKNIFQNPSLLSTMMSRTGIDMAAQYQTSLPKSVFDPASFPSYAYREELLKAQQATRATDEAEKKVQSAAGKRTIDFVSAMPSPSSTISMPGSQHKRKKP